MEESKNNNRKKLFAWDLNRELAAERRHNMFLEQHANCHGYIWALNEEEALEFAKLAYERSWEGTQEEVASIYLIGEVIVEEEIAEPSKLGDYIDINYKGTLMQKVYIPSNTIYRMEDIEEITVKARNLAINKRHSTDKKFAFVVDPETITCLKATSVFKDCMPGRDFFYVWAPNKSEAEKRAYEWLTEVDAKAAEKAAIHIVSEVSDYGRFEICVYSV
jgi:hypothetical protein